MKSKKKNHVVFDNLKNEMIVFPRQRKADLKRRMTEGQILVRGHTMRFNVEATRWLGMYLYREIQFRVYKNITLEKTKHAEERVRRLRSTYGLESGLIRWVQVTVVQEVALHGAEIWWQGQKGWCEKYRRLIIRQGRAVTGMFRMTPRIVLV